MSKNPLFRNEFYFFSGMYDDSLITDFYRKICSESFDRSVLYQHNVIGRKRHSSDNNIFYKAKLGDFIIDEKYNALASLPQGTRTLKINTLILPIHNKKNFIDSYGLKYQKVKLTDFYKKPNIFDRCISIQIGKYRVIHAHFIYNPDKTVTVAIYNSSDGIESKYFNKIFTEYSNTEPVWIFTDEITKMYQMNTNASTSISYIDNSDYCELKVPLSAALNTIGSPVHHNATNSWDCLISSSNALGMKFLSCCTCTLKNISDGCAIFSISKKFIEYITRNMSYFLVCVINRPNRKHLIVYNYDENTSPVLNLDYADNPSGNINLEVFELDASTMCKGRKLYDPEFTQVYFPNIFDFSKLNINKNDILIEITEYEPSYTNQVMRNSIKPLIESLGTDFYTEYVVNGYDTSLDGKSLKLKQYNPKYYPISVDDYLSSEYYGDIRGYFLDKIQNMIEHDPYLLESYHTWMQGINSNIVSSSGTPKTLRFGTGLRGEYTGSNPIVSDTSMVSISSDDIYYFDEPHSYITYYSSGKHVPSMVYLNGKYVRPTYTKMYKGIVYIFFPVSLFATEMNKYSTRESLISASPITVDVYTDAYTSRFETPTDTINISSQNESINIFQNIDNPKFTLSELGVYDEETGNFLGSLMDIFNINLFVSSYIINEPGFNDTAVAPSEEQVQYLLTALGEIYRTMDNKAIIVGSQKVTLSLNNFMDDLISSGIIYAEDGYKSFSHKKLDFNNIRLFANNPNLIGKKVIVYNRSFKSEYRVIPDSGTLVDNKNVYTLTKFNHDNDLNRYFTFIDGKLDTTANIYNVDNVYGGDLRLEIDSSLVTVDSDIIVVHMPVDYHRESLHATSNVMYMKAAITSGKSADSIWPSDDSAVDGVILNTVSGRLYNDYPLNSTKNVKFTKNGLRLPPGKSTNRIYGEYYDATQATIYGINNEDAGYVYWNVSDLPLSTMAWQNPLSETYDESRFANPLDILAKV